MGTTVTTRRRDSDWEGDTNRYISPMCTHALGLCIIHWALGYLTLPSAIANRVGTVKKGA